jgi:hypothetical protein
MVTYFDIKYSVASAMYNKVENVLDEDWHKTFYTGIYTDMDKKVTLSEDGDIILTFLIDRTIFIIFWSAI